MLKAIVFDFDGVIVDSEPLHFRAFVEVGKDLGVEMDYPTYLDKYIGCDDRDAFDTMLRSVGKTPEPGQIRKLGLEKAEVFEKLAADNVVTIPGAVALIEEAWAAAFPIAIASGATRADIMLMLNALSLADRFPVIVSADHVERSKPHPASYTLAAKQLAAHYPDAGITPETCLAIEDTAAGVRSAADAGMMTLGLATTGSAQILSQAQRVIDNLAGVTLETLRGWYDG